MSDRRRTVEAGYDVLAPSFGEWGARVVGDPWERFLEELAARLPADARMGPSTVPTILPFASATRKPIVRSNSGRATLMEVAVV